MNNCRRNLQDMDIPALLVFLRKNQDITHLNLASNNITDFGFISLLDHFLVRLIILQKKRNY